MITPEFDKEIIKESQRRRNEYMYCVNCGIDVEITGLGECPKCGADLQGATQLSAINANQVTNNNQQKLPSNREDVTPRNSADAIFNANHVQEKSE